MPNKRVVVKVICLRPPITYVYDLSLTLFRHMCSIIPVRLYDQSEQLLYTVLYVITMV